MAESKLEKTKICQLATLVQDIELLASNSASPTETAVATLEDGVTFYQQPIKTVFLKWFVNRPGRRDIGGLKYELRFYREVISPLLLMGVVPFFVRFLGASPMCSFEEIGDIVEHNRSFRKQKRTRHEIDAALRRNARFLVQSDRNFANRAQWRHQPQPLRRRGKRERKPALTEQIFTSPLDSGRELPVSQMEIDEDHFGVLVTEVQARRTVHDVLSGVTGERGPTDFRIVLHILFQVASALVALQYSQAMQNDLHTGNVLVTENREQSGSFDFGEQDRYFVARMPFLCLVFDFDRGFCRWLGPSNKNPMLKGNLCKTHSQCNKFVPNRDLAKFCCSLLRRYRCSRQSEHTAVGAKVIYDFIKKTLKLGSGRDRLLLEDEGCSLRRNQRPMPDSFYSQLGSPLDMVRACARELKYFHDVTQVQEVLPNTFICTPERFTTVGRLRKRPKPQLTVAEDQQINQLF